MLYDDIATTIILLPSVTKTFAMSTTVQPWSGHFVRYVAGKKGIGKLNASHRKELARVARELL